MKIFFSHVSSDKPLIREICQHFPDHLRSWVDEDELLVGEHIGPSIRDAISEASDFVVLIVSTRTVSSEWVRREVKWALQREKRLGRTFLLPVVVDISAWKDLVPKSEQARKYLHLRDFDRLSVKGLADQLVSSIFANVSRHIEQLREISAGPKIVVGLQANRGPGPDSLAALREQGAPDWALDEAESLLDPTPHGSFYVMCKNVGAGSALIVGHGILVESYGLPGPDEHSKFLRFHPYPPNAPPIPIDFEPGDYHQFAVGLHEIAGLAKSETIGFDGRVKVEGFYTDYEDTEYRSQAAWLDLMTYDIDFVRDEI